MKTIISVLLDRSGSMQGREADVVGGINKFIADQQKDAGEDTLTLARFDSQGLEIFRPRVKVADAAPIEATDFQPRGGTPLLDCLGKLIVQMDEDWKAEKPERAICVVFTDGEENESREYTKDKIAAMIKAREDSGMWSFIYMGAHAKAFHEARSMGFAAHSTSSNNNNPLGTAAAYSNLSATVSMRKSASHDIHSGAQFMGVIDDDGTAKPVAPPPPVTVKSSSTPSWTPPTPDTWTPPA